MADRADDRDDAGDDEVDQPSLSLLRQAVANRAPELPSVGTVRGDAIAGLNGALASVPDGMASGLLAGVNPIFGLYACVAGPLAAGVLTSTQLMVVATTSASALGAGQALLTLPEGDRAAALFMLVVLVGVLQIVFGLVGLGRLTRFVSYSVMTGFVAGIAVRTVLTQLPTVTGYEPEGANDVTRTLDLISHIPQLDLRIVIVSAVSLALVLILRQTRIGSLSTLIAIVAPSAVLVLLGISGVPAVRDVGEIPTGLPIPSLPALSAMSPDVVSGAFAVAIIVLVQGAGVSQSVPNPDGSRRRLSRDFVAQGAGNVASGLLQGLPVGGSLGTTALTTLSGARSRLTSIFLGLWMAAILVLLSGLVSEIAMATLGVVLIVATVSTIKPRDVRAVWAAGWAARVAAVATFGGLLLLPVQLAVLVGIVLSIGLYLLAAASDVSVVELIERPDGRIEEREPSETLASDRLTVIDVYGPLFFAAARTLERRLPRVDGARRPAVVIRLRGRTKVGATLIDVLAGYADRIEAAGGRLYLTGLADGVREELRRSGKVELNGPVTTYQATPLVGESTRRAVSDAHAWLVEVGQRPTDERRARRGDS